MSANFIQLPDVQATFKNWSFEFEGQKYIMRDTLIENKIVNTEYFDQNMVPVSPEINFEFLIKLEEFVENNFDDKK